MTDFAPYMQEVALMLLGDPNRHLSTGRELRWGNKGSLSIDLEKGTWKDHSGGDEDGGGVLDLIVHAGKAEDRRTAVEWLRQHGFTVEDREPMRRPNGNHAAPSKPNGPWRPAGVPQEAKIAKTYDYIDDEGILDLQVVRWEWPDPENPEGKPLKTFRQRRPDPSKPGGWVWSAEGAKLVPYRLKELRNALDAATTIAIVEGEKCVDFLRSKGVPATTNPMGAGKWPAHFADIFRGADVVIIQDNDPQARRKDKETGEEILLWHPDGRPKHPGKDHADAIAANLRPVASSVRVLSLPGLGQKEDVVEWFEKHGGSVDQLYDLVDRTPLWMPPSTFKSKFNALPWSRLDDAGEEHEWLCYGLLTVGELSIVAGASGAGKSFWVLALAFSIARGVPFFGARCLKGGVVYQAGEGGTGLKKRMRAYRQHHGLTPADDIPFVLLPAPVNLYAGDDPTSDLIEEIRYWSSTFTVPLRLVVIDTLAAATTGADENSIKDIGPVLARCARISKALNCSVLLVHHMNAGGEKIRGHTAILANVESTIVLSTAMQDEKTPLKDEQGRPIREAFILKQKDGERGKTNRFVLTQIKLGETRFGEPITSLVAVPPDEIEAEVDPVHAGIRVKDDHLFFLNCVRDALREYGEPPPLGLEDCTADVVVRQGHVARLYRMRDFDDNPDEATRMERIKKQLKRIGTHLQNKGAIGKGAVGDPPRHFVWFTGRRIRGLPASLQQNQSTEAIQDVDDPFSDLP